MADPPQATACAAQRWVVVALSESQGLARPLVERVGLEAVAVEERRFEGGEFKLRPLASVRGAGVFIVQSLAGSHGIAPAEGLLADAAAVHGNA